MSVIRDVKYCARYRCSVESLWYARTLSSHESGGLIISVISVLMDCAGNYYLGTVKHGEQQQYFLPVLRGGD